MVGPPEAYAPTSTALRATGARTPLHDKAVVLEEGPPVNVLSTDGANLGGRMLTGLWARAGNQDSISDGGRDFLVISTDKAFFPFPCLSFFFISFLLKEFYAQYVPLL
jgi:hypothetical protein